MSSKLIIATHDLLRELSTGPPLERAEYLLTSVKNNGRTPAVSGSFTEKDLDMLTDRYLVGKKGTSEVTLNEALTIIANALVLNRRLHATWDPHKAISKVLNESFQPGCDQLHLVLLLRLLFLFTFNGLPYDERTIKTCLAVVASKISQTSANDARFIDTADRQAFIECLKLTFNLLHFYSKQSVHYVQGYTAHDLVRIYFTLNPADPDNVVLFQHISNCLLCLPVNAWLYDSDSLSIMKRILEFIEKMVHPKNEQLREDRILSPPLSLVHSIVSDLFSPQAADLEDVRDYVRSRVLPSDKDRERPLGQSDSLCSYLLKVTIDPVLLTSRNIIFDIFWKVSHENPDEFVQNFGLGFASSFLASHGIAFPDSVTTDPSSASASSSSGQASSSASKPRINPITGQYMDHERHDPLQQPMTEEEKERDAERMFVLFERLNKSKSPIKVVNPVQLAQQSGKLEHIN